MAINESSSANDAFKAAQNEAQLKSMELPTQAAPKIGENKPKSQDKSKPVSSTPVSGTPWCVVWTGDNRSFFYNPTTKKSVWERPPELVGRIDVKEMLKSQSSAEKLKNKSQGGISQSTLSKSDSDSDDDEKERKSSEPQLVFEDELQKKSNQDKLLTKSEPQLVFEDELQKKSNQ